MSIEGKRLLILGATPETIPLINQANKMGVVTYVADPYKKAQAKKYAKHPINIDCFAVEELILLIEKEKIDGILPGCADILVPVYEELCERTNKHCYINGRIVDVLANKKGFKDELKKVGLPTIPEYSLSEALGDDFVDYPLFVKPIDNNSSKGVSIVDKRQDIHQAYDKALSFSKSKTVLIEKYLECDDISVGYVIQKGRVGVSFVSDRFVYRNKGIGSITSGIKYPSIHTKLYMEKFHDKVVALFDGIGLRNGIANMQGFVKDNEIIFYDPAVRITGGQNYYVYGHYCGFNVLEAIVLFAMTGEMPKEDLPSMCDPYFGGKKAACIMYAAKECVFGHVEGLERIKENKHVINILQGHQEADNINRIGTANQHCLKVHIIGDNDRELKEEVEKINKIIEIKDINGNDVMLTPVSASEFDV